jgi:hypothetical protein
MKVFVGWSGERSQALAQAFRDWIPLVLHYVEPWLSETDVAAGERWAQAMAKELEASNFGIISVTRDNVSSPWILFEAGSLGKSMEESRVIPLLLDLEFSEISGPLAQFQAKKADRGGLREVIHSINQAAAEPVPEPRANQLFEALWPQFEGKLSAIPKHQGSAKPIRPQHEILEELVASVRSLDSRLKDVEAMVSEGASRRGRFRRQPLLMGDMAMMMAEGPGDPIALLIAASLFKEDLPWLYELGMEAYRAARAGTPEEARSCVRRFRHAADLVVHGPLAEELGIRDRDLHIVVRQLEHLVLEEGPPKDAARARPSRSKVEPTG